MPLKPLRPFQQRTVEHVRDCEVFRRRPLCVQAPTGAGKTRIMGELLLDDKPQIVLTHRRFLLDQLSRELSAMGVRHGVRARGHAPDLAAPIQLAIYQSEYSRTFRKKQWPMHAAERIHVDEAHLFGGPVPAEIIGAYAKAGALPIGYSATPREIGHVFADLHVAATVPELIAAGYLVPPILFGPDCPDTERLEAVTRQANGDYSPAGVAKIWPTKAVFGRIVEHYHRLNPDHVPTILFAPGVAQSLWFAQRLTASGIRAAHIDGDCVWLDGEQYDSDKTARDAVFAGVRAGEIKIVCNRYVLREGLDLPEIGCAILATAFGSRSSYVQAAGRVLRPAPGKTQAIIIDHGGNWLRHPALDSAEPWDMTSAERIDAQARIEGMRGDGEREPICCPHCACVRLAGNECPECGFRSTKRARWVLQVNGELRLQQGPAYKARRIKRTPNSQDKWDRLFFGAKKYKPERTFQQVWSYYAFRNHWEWLPRDLKRQPVTDRGWFLPIGDARPEDLR